MEKSDFDTDIDEDETGMEAILSWKVGMRFFRRVCSPAVVICAEDIRTSSKSFNGTIWFDQAEEKARRGKRSSHFFAM